jgi:hypothetical protein
VHAVTALRLSKIQNQFSYNLQTISRLTFLKENKIKWKVENKSLQNQ